MIAWVDITPYIPQLSHGLLVTLQLMFCSLTVGLLLAVVLTLFGLSENKYLVNLVQSYVFIIRGTPLLVQFFLTYYGLSQFAWLRASPLWEILREPFACAVIALALNTAAYTAVLLMGTVRAIPLGEVDACRALGMSTGTMLRQILLPRAIQIALPSYANEVIMIFQSTSLASTVTLLDLMGVTQQINARTYASLQFFLIAGVIYLIFNGLISALFHLFEKRWGMRKLIRN